MDALRLDVIDQPRRARWHDSREVVLYVNEQPLPSLTGGRDLGGLTFAELPPSRHLLGEPKARLKLDGRAAILICPQCGDLGCGAVLVRIAMLETVVVWRDLIYANNYDASTDETIEGTFRFDRSEYETELTRAAAAAGDQP